MGMSRLTELKAGTRGTWIPRKTSATIIGNGPDCFGQLAIKDATGEYCVIDGEDFVPDPEPPTTVMVEMTVEDAEWAVHPVRGVSWAEEVAHQFRIERLQTAAAEALKKAGL